MKNWIKIRKWQPKKKILLNIHITISNKRDEKKKEKFNYTEKKEK